MAYCNESLISPQCSAQSVGASNQLFVTLLQTLLTAHCSISSPNKWPRDYGKVALEHGLNEYNFIVVESGSAGLADSIQFHRCKSFE